MRGISIPIGLDLTGLNRNIGDAKTKLSRGLGGAMKSLNGLMAGLTVGGAVAAMKGIADEFDRIGKLAARLDTDAETLQRLGRLAKVSGSDVETLARAMTRAAAAIGGTDGAAKKARASLESLGINADKFIAARLDQQVYMLADAYQSAGGKGKAFSDLLDIIGLRGAEMVPLFKKGGDELRRLGETMKVVSNENVAKMEKLNDQWAELVAHLKASTAEMAMMNIELGKGLGRWFLGPLYNPLFGDDPKPKAMAATADRTMPESDIARRNREFDEQVKAFQAAVKRVLPKDRAAPLGMSILNDIIDLAPAMQAELKSRAKKKTSDAVKILFDGPEEEKQKPAAKSAEAANDFRHVISDLRDVVNSDLVRIGGARGIGAIGDQGLELQKSSDRKLGEIVSATKATAEALSAFTYA